MLLLLLIYLGAVVAVDVVVAVVLHMDTSRARRRKYDPPNVLFPKVHTSAANS
jgi:hypothetical protein